MAQRLDHVFVRHLAEVLEELADGRKTVGVSSTTTSSASVASRRTVSGGATAAATIRRCGLFASGTAQACGRAAAPLRFGPSPCVRLTTDHYFSRPSR
jgi:hypothetical protein